MWGANFKLINGCLFMVGDIGFSDPNNALSIINLVTMHYAYQKLQKLIAITPFGL